MGAVTTTRVAEKEAAGTGEKRGGRTAKKKDATEDDATTNDRVKKLIIC